MTLTVIKFRSLTSLADHGYVDARLIKAMNMNAARMTHYPPDQAFLEACDELGLYVLDELSGWHHAYDTEVGRRLVRAMAERDVNHPSILFWERPGGRERKRVKALPLVHARGHNPTKPKPASGYRPQSG